MRTNPSLRLLLIVIALSAVGCSSTPAPINLYTVDAITGKSLPGVRVDHWDKSGQKTGGVTDASGRLDGLLFLRGDRLNLGKAGYEPVRLQIGIRGAAVVPVTRDPNHPEAAAGVEVNDPDAEPLPYTHDHTVTVLLRPR